MTARTLCAVPLFAVAFLAGCSHQAAPVIAPAPKVAAAPLPPALPAPVVLGFPPPPAPPKPDPASTARNEAREARRQQSERRASESQRAALNAKIAACDVQITSLQSQYNRVLPPDTLTDDRGLMNEADNLNAQIGDLKRQKAQYQQQLDALPRADTD